MRERLEHEAPCVNLFVDGGRLCAGRTLRPFDRRRRRSNEKKFSPPRFVTEDGTTFEDRCIFCLRRDATVAWLEVLSERRPPEIVQPYAVVVDVEGEYSSDACCGPSTVDVAEAARFSGFLLPFPRFDPQKFLVDEKEDGTIVVGQRNVEFATVASYGNLRRSARARSYGFRWWDLVPDLLRERSPSEPSDPNWSRSEISAWRHAKLAGACSSAGVDPFGIHEIYDVSICATFCGLFSETKPRPKRSFPLFQLVSATFPKKTESKAFAGICSKLYREDSAVRKWLRDLYRATTLGLWGDGSRDASTTFLLGFCETKDEDCDRLVEENVSLFALFVRDYFRFVVENDPVLKEAAERRQRDWGAFVSSVEEETEIYRRERRDGGVDDRRDPTRRKDRTKPFRSHGDRFEDRAFKLLRKTRKNRSSSVSTTIADVDPETSWEAMRRVHEVDGTDKEMISAATSCSSLDVLFEIARRRRFEKAFSCFDAREYRSRLRRQSVCDVCEKFKGTIVYTDAEMDRRSRKKKRGDEDKTKDPKERNRCGVSAVGDRNVAWNKISRIPTCFKKKSGGRKKDLEYAKKMTASGARDGYLFPDAECSGTLVPLNFGPNFCHASNACYGKCRKCSSICSVGTWEKILVGPDCGQCEKETRVERKCAFCGIKTCKKEDGTWGEIDAFDDDGAPRIFRLCPKHLFPEETSSKRRFWSERDFIAALSKRRTAAASKRRRTS